MPDLPAMRSKPAPYQGGVDPATASPSGEPFISNPQRGDARNWMRRVASIFAPSGNRNAVRTTDDTFQEQRAPFRIPRLFTTGRGLTGPNTDGLPLTGSWAYIPGQDMSTKDAGRIRLMPRTSDDAVSIPAIYAGNPPTGA